MDTAKFVAIFSLKVLKKFTYNVLLDSYMKNTHIGLTVNARSTKTVVGRLGAPLSRLSCKHNYV